MTRYNRYIFGTGAQTVYYLANGVADDWMYGDTGGKEKIMSLTPEVGNANDGFWPTIARIPELAQENVHANLYIAKTAGGFVKITSTILVESGDKNGFFDPGESVKVVLNLKNIGQGEAQNIHFSLKAASGLVVQPPANTTIGLLLPQTEVQSDTFEIKIDDSVASGLPLILESLVETDGLLQADTTQDAIIGAPTISFNFDAESGSDTWTGDWGLSDTEAFEGSYSFTDSPVGSYQENATTMTTLRVPLDLKDAQTAYLEFWAKWAIEPNFDYGQAAASTDGINWVALSGQFTHIAALAQEDDRKEPAFSGKQGEWVKERMSLTAFAGEPRVFLRFFIKSVSNELLDGWYIDALQVKTYKDSTGVAPPGGKTPYRITLAQNYPNPFNPTTRITFELPSAGSVSLVIYDMRGRHIRTLINEYRLGGSHEIIFDGSHLPSGLYFYKLQSGKTTRGRKMVLLR